MFIRAAVFFLLKIGILFDWVQNIACIFYSIFIFENVRFMFRDGAVISILLKIVFF